MFKYLSQRVFLAIITIIAITIIVYLLSAAFIENPFAIASQSINTEGGKNASTDQSKQAAKIINYINESKRLHLIPQSFQFDKNNPNAWITVRENPFIRFGYWVASIFDSKHPFGEPINYQFPNGTGETIPQYVFFYLKYSIILSLPSFLISAALGIILGIWAGYKRGKLIDGIINLFSQFFSALPSFVLAPIAILIFVLLNIPSAAFAPTAENISTYTFSLVIKSWISPILVITLGSLAGYIIYTRNQVVTVLTSNYILIAKAKGLNGMQIFFKYVLRNISIPLATILIPSYIGLLTGSFIIEKYYNYPGVSQVLIQAFPNGMLNIIMFNLVFFTTLSIMTQIIVDVSYVLLDPALAFASSGKSYIRLFKAKKARDVQFRENEIALNAQESTL